MVKDEGIRTGVGGVGSSPWLNVVCMTCVCVSGCRFNVVLFQFMSTLGFSGGWARWRQAWRQGWANSGVARSGVAVGRRDVVDMIGYRVL